MNGKIASGKNSILGPDGYEDTPREMVEAYESAVFVEDNFPPPEELKRELKRTITIRLDPDVYSWFQLPGAGYQTRINAVLRRYMELQKAAKKMKPPAEKKRSLSEVTGVQKSVRGVARKAKTGKHVVAKAAARKSSKKGNPSHEKKVLLAKATSTRAVRA